MGALGGQSPGGGPGVIAERVYAEGCIQRLSKWGPGLAPTATATAWLIGPLRPKRTRRGWPSGRSTATPGRTRVRVRSLREPLVARAFGPCRFQRRKSRPTAHIEPVSPRRCHDLEAGFLPAWTPGFASHSAVHRVTSAARARPVPRLLPAGPEPLLEICRCLRTPRL